MTRFLRLRTVVLNLEAIAVIRPVGPDTVSVVTTLGYTEYLEGDDATDLLAYVLDGAARPVPSGAHIQLVHAWLAASRTHDEYEYQYDEMAVEGDE
jgi:hypothetical protein